MSASTAADTPTRPAAAQRSSAPPPTSCIGRYATEDTGALREIIHVPGAGGSTLVIDRLEGTHADARLVAHLAADEPPGNAAVVCSMYLADGSRGRCRSLTARDLDSAPFVDAPVDSDDGEASLDTPLLDAEGIRYCIREVCADGSFPELRWTRSLAPGAREPFEPLSLRDVVARLHEYEPARTLTLTALASLRDDRRVSTHRLEGELKRVASSPIVLNRRLREVVTQRLASGDLTMSEIAIRCGRTKRDSRGNVSGETSWLARRIGQLPEGGETEPTPWISSDVLALIAREGLGVSPREVELA